MGFPLCHMIMDENDEIFRLVVVELPGKYVDYIWDGLGASSESYDSANKIFDTAESAEVYMGTSSQARRMYRFESIQDVSQNKIDLLIKKLGEPKIPEKDVRYE